MIDLQQLRDIEIEMLLSFDPSKALEHYERALRNASDAVERDRATRLLALARHNQRRKR